MKPETELAIRRWTIRKLRMWFDAFHEWADARIHVAEVRLRDECVEKSSLAECGAATSARVKTSQASPPHPVRESFLQWEARKSGIAPVSKKSARRRGMPARAFDLRFSTR
jgi:hypothetical protein